MTIIPTDTYTPEQVAEWLHRSVKTVYRLERGGRIHRIPGIGGALYLGEVLLAFARSERRTV